MLSIVKGFGKVSVKRTSTSLCYRPLLLVYINNLLILNLQV
jgi:hypothetical protein